MKRSEELTVYKNMLEEQEDYLTAYNEIPYGLLRDESPDNKQIVIDEVNRICKYYNIYRRGKSFTVEGTNGDYIPAQLKYKMAYSLINKEARFLFAEQPDILVKPKGDLAKSTDESRQALTVMNDLVKTILSKNSFEDILIKGARDCFIGKRVAGVVNFNEMDGVTITFVKSTHFLFETKPGNPNVLSKFVCFVVITDSMSLADRRVMKKKYTLEEDDRTNKYNVYLEEDIYDGAGRHIENLTSKQKILLDFIPAFVIINDGLTGECLGESEIELLSDFETWYSKLANADSDAERKSMNPTKYLVDMESNSTKGLSTAAGALWDLGSDQNLESPNVKVGMLESQMNYYKALDTSLNRIKTAGYELVDMPNITLETMQGAITSGKALKAIYWPLIVRCKEKMKVWGPALSKMVDIIIEGAIVYPNCVKRYTDDTIVKYPYEVSVVQNTPLPEDEIEEKTTDLAEIESQTMSRKTYMQKWRGLTDDQVMDELNQIALERQILEDSSFNNGLNGDNSAINKYTQDDFMAAGVNAINKDGTQNADGKNGAEQNIGQQDSNEVSQSQVSSLSAGKPEAVQNQIERLNGVQVSSLIRILSEYRSGILSRAQAVSLITSMGLTEKFADSLLDEEDKKAK